MKTRNCIDCAHGDSLRTCLNPKACLPLGAPGVEKVVDILKELL